MFKEQLPAKEKFHSSLTSKKLVTKNMIKFLTLLRMGAGAKRPPLPVFPL